MTTYRCPRHDLGCAELFRTTGDLDWHCHQVHGYRHGWRMVSSFSREVKLPIGPEPRRRVPDGLEGGPGTPTMSGMGASATAAQARSKHRDRSRDDRNRADRSRDGRGREKEPVGGRAKHRTGDTPRRSAKTANAAGRGKHAARP